MAFFSLPLIYAAILQPQCKSASREMDLYQQGSGYDLGSSFANVAATSPYQPPTIAYTQAPPAYGVSYPPPVYGQQGLYLPPGVTDTTLVQMPQQVQIDNVKIATGRRWNESGPVITYMALAIAGLILIVFTPGTGWSKILHLLGAIIWIVVWGVFIVWAVRKNKIGLAWVLAIVPFVIWLVFQILLFVRAVTINY